MLSAFGWNSVEPRTMPTASARKTATMETR
jgi:hypothetical protein